LFTAIYTILASVFSPFCMFLLAAVFDGYSLIHYITTDLIACEMELKF